MWIFATLLSLTAAQLTCSNCRVMMNSLSLYLNDPALLTSLETLGKQLCQFPLVPASCDSLSPHLIQATFKTVASRYLNPDWVCSATGSCPYPTFELEDFDSWAEAILSEKALNQQSLAQSLERGSTLKFAQITDLHVDPEYQVGAPTMCETPPCCHGRAEAGGAGKWGAYNCDVPPATVTKALQLIEDEGVEFILWTGGTAPHDFSMSLDQKVDIIEEVTDEILKRFKPADTPVFPMFGGDDAFPPHQFSFELPSTQVTSYLASYWHSWLGKSTNSFQKTGFYTAPVKDWNLKVIGINTLACDYLNLYLTTNVTDPGLQLAALNEELLKAESNGEFIYIIGDIPPASKYCLSEWGKHYSVLVDRFRSTIKGQFFGFTTEDEIKVSTEYSGSDSIGVQFIAPPVSSYYGRNPSVRIYEFDSETFEITNYYQFRLELAQENAEFQQVYQFKDYFLTSEISPTTVDDLAYRIKSNELVALKYAANKFAGGPQTPALCDDWCQYDLFCEISSDNSAKLKICQRLSDSLVPEALQSLYGPWTIKKN